MAVRAKDTKNYGGGHLVKWEGLLNGDTGTPVEMEGYPDRSIQFIGTFGAGGSVSLMGSNDSTNGTDGTWFALTDPQGNAITKTAAAGEAVTELTRWIRPHVTAGDGTTDIDAFLWCGGKK